MPFLHKVDSPSSFTKGGVLFDKIVSYCNNSEIRTKSETESKAIFLGRLHQVKIACHGKEYYKLIGILNGCLNHEGIKSKTFCDKIRRIIIQEAEPVRLEDEKYYSSNIPLGNKKGKVICTSSNPFEGVISLNIKRKDIKQKHLDEIDRIAKNWMSDDRCGSILLEAQVLALSCRSKTVYEKIKTVLEKYMVVDTPQSQPIEQAQPIVSKVSHSVGASIQPSCDEIPKKAENSGGEIDYLINDILSQVENKKILTEEKKYIKSKIKEWESKLDKENRHIDLMILKVCLELKVNEGILSEDNFNEIYKIIQQRLNKLAASKNTILEKIKSKVSGEFKITEEDTIWDAIFKKIKQGSISDNSLSIILDKIQEMYKAKSYGYSEFKLGEVLNNLLVYKNDPVLKADLVIEKVKPIIEDALSIVSQYVIFNGQRSQCAKEILNQMNGCEKIAEKREAHFKNFVENMLCNSDLNKEKLYVFRWYLKEQVEAYTIEPLQQKLKGIVEDFFEKRTKELEDIERKKAEELAKKETENLTRQKQAKKRRTLKNTSTSQVTPPNSIFAKVKKWFSNAISRIGNSFVKLWANR
ncbi:hypothetical protein AB7Z98_03080 [Providencia manganoxydans]|uniref:hypothetical protein n=1 Tax=Providencia manganoxydans TaxID=2923283 RepID=UPI0034E40F7C